MTRLYLFFLYSTALLAVHQSWGFDDGQQAAGSLPKPHPSASMTVGPNGISGVNTSSYGTELTDDILLDIEAKKCSGLEEFQEISLSTLAQNPERIPFLEGFDDFLSEDEELFCHLLTGRALGQKLYPNQSTETTVTERLQILNHLIQEWPRLQSDNTTENSVDARWRRAHFWTLQAMDGYWHTLYNEQWSWTGGLKRTWPYLVAIGTATGTLAILFKPVSKVMQKFSRKQLWNTKNSRLLYSLTQSSRSFVVSQGTRTVARGTISESSDEGQGSEPHLPLADTTPELDTFEETSAPPPPLLEWFQQTIARIENEGTGNKQIKNESSENSEIDTKIRNIFYRNQSWGQHETQGKSLPFLLQDYFGDLVTLGLGIGSGMYAEVKTRKSIRRRLTSHYKLIRKDSKDLPAFLAQKKKMKMKGGLVIQGVSFAASLVPAVGLTLGGNFLWSHSSDTLRSSAYIHRGLRAFSEYYQSLPEREKLVSDTHTLSQDGFVDPWRPQFLKEKNEILASPPRNLGEQFLSQQRLISELSEWINIRLAGLVNASLSLARRWTSKERKNLFCQVNENFHWEPVEEHPLDWESVSEHLLTSPVAKTFDARLVKIFQASLTDLEWAHLEIDGIEHRLKTHPKPLNDILLQSLKNLRLSLEDLTDPVFILHTALSEATYDLVKQSQSLAGRTYPCQRVPLNTTPIPLPFED